jgi:hypothetical protein
VEPDPYSTHLPILTALAVLPIRRVLELGGGDYSTRLFLDRSVFPELERLTTVETNPEWAARVKTRDRRHRVLPRAPLHRNDLILVDDSDHLEGRVQTLNEVSDARLLALVVIHDFEQPDYQEATRFDHLAVSTRLTPWTAVAWNEGSRHGSPRVHRLVSDA